MPKRTDTTTFAVGVLVILTTASSAFSCTVSTTDVLLHSNFVVEVKNGSTPLEGVAVEIEKISDKRREPPLTQITDGGGFAKFVQVHLGRYYVIIKHPWLRHSIAVKVVSTRDRKARDVMSLDWPGNVLTTRDFAGRILAPRKTDSAVWDLARPQWQLLSSTVFFVEDAITSQVLRIYKTNESGEFRLELPAGLYVVRFGQSDRFRIPEGAFAVEVTPASPDLVLNVKLTTMCGGLYALRADN